MDAQPRACEELTALLLPEGLALEWTPAEPPPPEDALALQRDLFRRFHEAADPGEWLFRLGFAPAHIALAESLGFWQRISAEFAKRLVLAEDLESRRGQASVPLDDATARDLLAGKPFGYGSELLTRERFAEIWDGLNRTFRNAIARHEGSVASFLRALRPDLELAGRVFFHLVENRKGPSPFAFLATYSTHVGADGAARHVPLKHALQEFAGNREKLLDLLATVYRAAGGSALLPGLLDSGRIFHPLAMDGRQALTFLKEVPLYENCGIRCRIPNWWTAKSTRVSVSVQIGEREPSTLGLQALVSCVPRLQVGGEPIGVEEARRLLTESEGLVLIKNRWVEVDHATLSRTLAAYEQAGHLLAEGMTLGEAMRFMLEPEKMPGLEAVDSDVSYGAWLRETTRKLADPTVVRSVTPPADFTAVLRPYQQVGLNWLAFLDSLGFGACLADDMGLGKTIQVLAFLAALKDRFSAPSLLVVPASLLGNWQDEIRRFLPSLRIIVAHASAVGAKARDGFSQKELSAADLVITTYGMTQRSDWLRNAPWHYVILDEAQAIKNPGARQTRAVKELKSRNRMVLTGTPVENRVGDLWSLFDFLNPGLLGTAREFRDTARRLRDEPDGYARLRRLIGPYVLRRLKTDRSIIADLPEKVEMKSYAELSRRQVVLYRALVDELAKSLEAAEGIQRRGLVLAALLKFKQICNHPDQYVGGQTFAEHDSGKFARLRDVCATILDVHERVLVFTQFREMTAPLDRFLAELFGHPGLVIHGGVPVKKRREIVDRFQNSRDYIPYLVLSVRAAGVGLNLTRANHVVHFDRWWNPAVENQATDRAFRIGQQKNVVVHKFITAGTVEEKIDRLIADKVDLAAAVVAESGENWITEMDNRQLLDLFTLAL